MENLTWALAGLSFSLKHTHKETKKHRASSGAQGFPVTVTKCLRRVPTANGPTLRAPGVCDVFLGLAAQADVEKTHERVSSPSEGPHIHTRSRSENLNPPARFLP